jgi:flagellar basal-body rod modification protein FlgD
MTGLSAVSNQPSIFGQNLPGTQTKATSAASKQSTATDSSSSASIGANDFLTLLVTEMKNQDPTANSDPNAYVNQLVQVNSLEQLISINQNLSTALGTSSTPGVREPASQTTSAEKTLTGNNVAGVATGQTRTPKTNAQASAPAAPAGARLAPGNLSIPDSTPAALRVAQALGGHPKTHLNSPAL